MFYLPHVNPAPPEAWSANLKPQHLVKQLTKLIAITDVMGQSVVVNINKQELEWLKTAMVAHFGAE